MIDTFALPFVINPFFELILVDDLFLGGALLSFSQHAKFKRRGVFSGSLVDVERPLRVNILENHLI